MTNVKLALQMQALDSRIASQKATRDQAKTGDDASATREGRARIVYPEIHGGRVFDDVEVGGLGDYFVGERTRVYIDDGRRKAIELPAGYV